MKDEKAQQQPTITNKLIGGTTYVVSSTFNENAKETVVEKVKRLIIQESKNIS